VNAGLELGAQVHAGLLPEPARIYLALGSRGSAAGLAAGLALAGLQTRVVSVLVTHRLPASKRGIERLARRSLGELARAGARVAADSLPLALEVESGFRGPGYGHATPEGAEAVRLARDCEGIELERTYTGKALAALLARERGRAEPVLFWNTYAGAAPDLELPDWRALPRSFQRFFRDAEGA
jgi:D-cysteine desulfhydrase